MPNGCRVKLCADPLDKDDQDFLFEAVGDRAWPIKTLQRRLREGGIEVSEEAISKHRNQVCQCFPAKVKK